jgi:heme/copper-type cytochrome/quinol oxidase subunit 1
MKENLKEIIQSFVEVCIIITITLTFLTGIIYLINIIGKEFFENFLLIIIYIIIFIGTISTIYYMIRFLYKNLKK